MSAASTGANHLEHVKTMAWYIIPVGIATALAFTFMGLTFNSLGANQCLLLSLALGITLSIALLETAQYLFSKRS